MGFRGAFRSPRMLLLNEPPEDSETKWQRPGFYNRGLMIEGVFFSGRRETC
jgi:hypothetical protein